MRRTASSCFWHFGWGCTVFTPAMPWWATSWWIMSPAASVLHTITSARFLVAVTRGMANIKANERRKGEKSRLWKSKDKWKSKWKLWSLGYWKVRHQTLIREADNMHRCLNNNHTLLSNLTCRNLAYKLLRLVQSRFIINDLIEAYFYNK